MTKPATITRPPRRASAGAAIPALRSTARRRRPSGRCCTSRRSSRAAGSTNGRSSLTSIRGSIRSCGSIAAAPRSSWTNGAGQVEGPAAIVAPPGVVHGFRFAPETEGLVLTLSARFLVEGEHPAAAEAFRALFLARGGREACGRRRLGRDGSTRCSVRLRPNSRRRAAARLAGSAVARARDRLAPGGGCARSDGRAAGHARASPSGAVHPLSLAGRGACPRTLAARALWARSRPFDPAPQSAGAAGERAFGARDRARAADPGGVPAALLYRRAGRNARARARLRGSGLFQPVLQAPHRAHAASMARTEPPARRERLLPAAPPELAT